MNITFHRDELSQIAVSRNFAGTNIRQQQYFRRRMYWFCWSYEQIHRRSASQRRRRLVRIYWSFFNQSTTSQRRRRFVKIIGFFRLICYVADSSKVIGHFSTNLRRRSDFTDSSKISGHFRLICDVTATSQIRRNSSAKNDENTIS